MKTIVTVPAEIRSTAAQRLSRLPQSSAGVEEMIDLDPTSFITTLAAKNREFYSDKRGQGALRDLQQTFHAPWIYLAELVQNAVDARATHIRLLSRPDGGLDFEHNGEAFSPANVEGLCMRGVSSKGVGTVGFMGVGFKSVFKAYERVVITSGPWSFRLTVPWVSQGGEYRVRDWIGAVLPEWDADGVMPLAPMICRFAFSQREIETGSSQDDLTALLGVNDALLALLAWRGIDTFECNSAIWTLKCYESATADTDASLVRVSADCSDGRKRRWQMVAVAYEPSTAAVKAFLEHRQIRVEAAELPQLMKDARATRLAVLFFDVDGTNSPSPSERGHCFALLPSGQTTCLGVHLQADWLMDVGRREPMQLAGNPWQEQILEQVPRLMRHYIEWVVSDETGEGWARGYRGVPGESNGQEIDTALLSEEMLAKFACALTDCECVPYGEADGRINFARPGDARVLPGPLQLELSDSATATKLFGCTVASAEDLGPRGTKFFRQIGILQELNPKEIGLVWGDGHLQKWFSEAESDRENTLMALVRGLAGLDQSPEWSSAELPCLRAADGSWQSRSALKRFPPVWAFVTDAAVRAALEPHVGSPNTLLDWGLDQRLRQDTKSSPYLSRIKSEDLSNVAARWWSSMPSAPSMELQALVVAFSDMARRQPGAGRIVGSVLVESNGEMRLVPNAQSVVAQPYAGAYRARVFDDLAPIAPAYLQQVPSVTDAGWRTFFEELVPKPFGRFVLTLISSKASASDIGSAGSPARRSARTRQSTFMGVNVSSDTYYRFQCVLPTAATAILEAPTPSKTTALQAWILEARAGLKPWSSPKLVYFPPESTEPSDVAIPEPAPWIKALHAHPWLFTSSGDGPFSPDEILDAYDASRPNARVAALVDGFAELASDIGLTFGAGVPNAPALDRLRAFWASSDAAALSKLLSEAAVEAQASDDPKVLEALERELNEHMTFWVPSDVQPPDGAKRIPWRRVARQRERSNLGGWVVFVEELPENSPVRDCLELAAEYVGMPRTTSVTQVLDYLAWVWDSKPEADLVRQVLPRAFQYVLEEPPGEAAVEAIQRTCVVYSNRREWVPAASPGVYWNDLGLKDSDARQLHSALHLATAGHLGDDDTQQSRVAALLGLRGLSTRFFVSVREGAALSTPDRWGQVFEMVQNRLWELVETENAEDGGNGVGTGIAARGRLALERRDGLTRVVMDRGVEVQSGEVSATLRSDTALVVGEPWTFAAELTTLLLDECGLAGRRDAYQLAAMAAGLIGQMENEEAVAAMRAGTASKSGVQSAQKVMQGPQNMPLGAQQGGAPDQGPDTRAPGDRHTPERKDARQDAGARKIKELEDQLKALETQLREGLSLGIEPEVPDRDSKSRVFRSDAEYRDAALQYESANRRYPVAMDGRQAGFDLESYSHPEGDPGRRLVRRIEVKGVGGRWEGREMVELSDRQFKDALHLRNDGLAVDHTFDYWLYVVETLADGKLAVLPIRNPAVNAAKFEVRAAPWRRMAEG